MVECELYFAVTFIIALLVLIDTWWNVNELIHAVQGTRDLSFNRYMVECELFTMC